MNCVCKLAFDAWCDTCFVLPGLMDNGCKGIHGTSLMMVIVIKPIIIFNLFSEILPSLILLNHQSNHRQAPDFLDKKHTLVHPKRRIQAHAIQSALYCQAAG